MAKATSDDPLVEYLLPRIRTDKSDDELSAAQVLDGLAEESFLERKGQRVCTSRWSSWVDAVAEVIPTWHSRLLVLLHSGQVQGWLSNKKAVAWQALQKNIASTVRAAEEEEKKAPMKEEKEKLRKMRDSCANTLHLVATMLADHRLRSQVCCVWKVLRPWRRAHGILSQKLRSGQSHLEYVVDMASEQTWLVDALNDLTDPWSDGVCCVRIGLLMEVKGVSMEVMEGTGRKDEQEQIATRLIKLIVHVVKNMISSFAYWWCDVPHCLAGLLSPSVTKRYDTLQFLAAVDGCYQGMKGSDSPFWKRLGHGARAPIWTFNYICIRGFRAIAGHEFRGV